MPKPRHYFDVEDVYGACSARVHDDVGGVPQREFAVEVNLLRAHLIESGQNRLLIEIQPTSGLNADQLRGLVFLVRESRQRGVSCAFCGGGREVQQTLSKFGMSKPADWFPSPVEALAAITGVPPVPPVAMPPAQYGAVPSVPYPAMPAQPYAAPPPHPYAAMPPLPYPAAPPMPGTAAVPPLPFPTPTPTPQAPAAALQVPTAASQPNPDSSVPHSQPASARTTKPRGQLLQAHELTLRGHHRQPILATPLACSHLAMQIREVSSQLHFSVWAFVFMPDHFHLLVQSQRLNYDIGDYLEAIKQGFHEPAVEILGEHAPQVLSRLRRRQGNNYVYDFWQRTSGQNRNIDFARPIRPLIDHYHQNPVRRGLVERATDWKWSSAGAFAGAPLSELQPDPVPPELLGP